MIDALRQEPFGTDRSGRRVDRFTLTNAHGLSVAISTRGAAVMSIGVPDRTGRRQDVVLGYATLNQYLTADQYLGSCIGRFSNRIRDSRLVIDGVTHHLAPNDRAHCLHGGPVGFDQAVWEVVRTGQRPACVELAHVSPAGDQGFPGEVQVTVTYTLTEDTLVFETSASTDAATVLNLTNHSYFDLSGTGDGIDDHLLWIDADEFCEIDAELVATGQRRAVEGTPLDFRRPRPIGVVAVDHTFVLNGDTATKARLTHRPSGRTMAIETTNSGIHLYTGDGLSPPFATRRALCLEAHAVPLPTHDAVIVRPGEQQRTITRFRFGLD